MNPISSSTPNLMISHQFQFCPTFCRYANGWRQCWYRGYDQGASGLGPGSQRPSFRGGDQDRHVSGQRPPGDPQTTCPDTQVTRVQKVPGPGQVARRRHTGGHKVRLRKVVPYFPGKVIVQKK